MPSKVLGVRSNGSTGATPDGFTRARRYATAVGQAPGATDFSVVSVIRNRGRGLDNIVPFFGNSTDLVANGWFMYQVADAGTNPIQRGFGFSVIDSGIQSAAYSSPLLSPVNDKFHVIVGTYEGGTAILSYDNGLQVGRDATVGATIAPGEGRLELGYLGAASGDVAMNNDIIAAGYIPNVVLTPEEIQTLTNHILETGGINSLNGTSNFLFTHLYEAYTLVGAYNAGTAGLLPTAWANLGSAGTEGDMTLQTGSTSGTLEALPTYPY